MVRFISDRSINELIPLFYNPQEYTIRIDDDSVELRRATLFCSNNLLRASFDGAVVVIPGTAAALAHCREMARCVHRYRSALFAPCELRKIRVEELAYTAEALVYPTPVGVPLEVYVADILNDTNGATGRDCLGDQQRAALYAAVDLLEAELSRCCTELCITPSNLVMGGDGRLYPLYLETMATTTGTTPIAGCDELRAWLRERCGEPPVGHTPVELDEYRLDFGCELSSDDDCLDDCAGDCAGDCSGDFATIGHMHEGRTKIHNGEALYGFVDADGEVVITPQYLSVEDFRESRAVVESHNGYGLIDLWGGVIIPAIYAELSYNETTGITAVRRDDLWQYISYNGEILSAPSPNYPDENFRA